MAARTFLARSGWVAGAFLVAASAAADAAPSDASAWEALGDAVLVDGDGWVNEPTLLTGGDGAPVLSFASGAWNQQGVVHVWRWRDAHWAPVGAPIAGALSALTLDGAGHPWVCSARPLRVHRWDGARWTEVGGDVAQALALGTNPRFSVARCDGIAIDADDAVVISYVGHDAAPLYTNRVARLAAGAWLALPETPLSQGRSAGSRLVRGAGGALYLAAFTSAELPSPRRDLRVLRRDPEGWTPLGPDFEDAYAPALIVRDGQAHVAFQGLDGNLRALRFDGARWQALPSPGAGGSAALAVDDAGRLVLAHTTVHPLPPPELATVGVVVKVLVGDRWRALPGIEGGLLFGGVALALTIDGAGRPVVVAAGTASDGRMRMLARRSRTALPTFR